MDALYTTTKVATLIRSKNADYILALKQNQGNLYAEVSNFFNQAKAVDAPEAGVDIWSEERIGHGRRETVKITVCNDLEWLPQRDGLAWS